MDSINVHRIKKITLGPVNKLTGNCWVATMTITKTTGVQVDIGLFADNPDTLVVAASD